MNLEVYGFLSPLLEAVPRIKSTSSEPGCSLCLRFWRQISIKVYRESYVQLNFESQGIYLDCVIQEDAQWSRYGIITYDSENMKNLLQEYGITAYRPTIKSAKLYELIPKILALPGKPIP